jgi:hypothetical protein
MKSKSLAVVLLAAFISLLAAPLAQAADIPLLSWERGKQQNIVLGGASTNAQWKIFLTAPGQSDREFSPSLPNKAGYVVYSIELPNDLPLGGYSIEARAKGSPNTTVAAVNLIARTYYTIASIPTDLRLLFTLYALIISTFTVLRSRKYAYLTFTRDKSHSRQKSEEIGTSRVIRFLQPFYKFRSRRQAEMEISFLKFISIKDGETLHKISPSVWAVTPFATFLAGIFMSYSIQATSVVPNVALPLIILVSAIGAFDAISGATAALGFIFASFILGDITGMRSFLAITAFVMSWCVPSMLATMYLFALRIDLAQNFFRLSSKVKQFLALIVSSLIGSSVVIIFAIVTDSLVINNESRSFLRWPLAAIIAFIILVKNYFDIGLDNLREKREVEIETIEESIELSQTMSSRVKFLLTTAIFGIVYVWTQNASQSLFATAVISAPFFLRNISLPRFIAKRLKTVSRNLLVEILAVSALTVLVYEGVQRLPMSTREKAQAFILVGLVPVLLHSVYSAVIDKAEIVSSEKEDEVSSEA